MRPLAFVFGALAGRAVAQSRRMPQPKLVSLPPVSTPAVSSGAGALGALAVGSFAAGALAVGALAIGALAIGKLAVRKAKFGEMEIDGLTVRRLRVLEDAETDADEAKV
jgi:O-antigen ligase